MEAGFADSCTEGSFLAIDYLADSWWIRLFSRIVF
jgi:hypothetical protein